MGTYSNTNVDFAEINSIFFILKMSFNSKFYRKWKSKSKCQKVICIFVFIDSFTNIFLHYKKVVGWQKKNEFQYKIVKTHDSIKSQDLHRKINSSILINDHNLQGKSIFVLDPCSWLNINELNQHNFLPIL